jgi:hypothetical protein
MTYKNKWVRLLIDPRFEVDFGGGQCAIEISFHTAGPPPSRSEYTPPEVYQLLARNKGENSWKYILLSREFEGLKEYADFLAELRKGFQVLSDNSPINETRQRIIEGMLRMKAIEEIQPPPV